MMRSEVKIHSRSLVIGATTLFPVQNPNEIAAKLQPLIREIEDRAFEAGRRAMQADMKALLGLSNSNPPTVS
jgi:hypothetical protein